MPGILPMKLIKCGSSQTRIAQACDRCRSKKIRCDGVRPCCSQCANVGFECKTSDKLSRRAFPRGYTESLEERVRQLEAEVRELKDLLDTKDEQLDMVSRIHSFSPYSPPMSGATGGPHRAGTTRQTPALDTPSSSGDDSEEGFTMNEPAFLVNDGTGSFYLGGSSGLPFVDFFKTKLQDSGRLAYNFDIGSFFTQSAPAHSSNQFLPQNLDSIPARITSDQSVNNFFQEYHALFPIIHRPTFLKEYEKLASLCEASVAPSQGLSSHSIAQLYLVFAIGARNSSSQNDADLRSFDDQWKYSLNQILLDTSLETVQCLLLAQLYCFTLGDFQRLAQYKSLCVGMVLRMGLHRSQKEFSQNALISELKKRTFWVAYCLDSFSAALLGLPRLMKDEDITTEYPADIDDQYITQDGFLTALPGEFTTISSAIALFRCSRVLANVLDNIYPITLAHEQTYRRLKELEDELDSWKAELAPHLRLEFVNGVPATNVIHSRSPLLVLAYHYIRVLIHRPVVRSNEGSAKASPSFLAMTDSSKHIVQIIQLFTERKLHFAFCLNKNYLLILSGFAILYGAVNYQQKGSLAKESDKLISGIVHELEKSGYEKVNEFRRIAETIVTIESMVTQDLGTVAATAKRASLSPMSTHVDAPISPMSSPNQEGQSLRRRMSSISAKFLSHRKEVNMPTGGTLRRANSHSIDSTGYANHPLSRRNTMVIPMSDISNTGRIQTTHSRTASTNYSPPATMDYSHWAYEASSGQANASNQHKSQQSKAPANTTDDWVKLIAVMDASHGSHIYGGGQVSAAASAPAINAYGLCEDGWGMEAYNLPATSTSSTSSLASHHQAQLQQNPQFSKLQIYNTAPPSVSSFSTLSDESYHAEENMGRVGNSPVTAADISDLATTGDAFFGGSELRGVIGSQNISGSATTGYDSSKDLDVWSM